MIEGSDGQALALDLAAASGAFDRVTDLMRTVTGYGSGLEKLDLSPGQAFGSTFDPFEKLPGLRQSLVTARANGGAWSGVGNTLWMSLLMSAYEMSAGLTDAAAGTRGTVDAAKAAGRALTQAEVDSITGTLRRLQRTLETARNKIDASGRETVDFVRLISGDYEKLTTSAERLEGALTWIDEWLVRTGTKYIMDQGMLKMVTEYAAAWRKKVVAANDAVHGLAGANDKAQYALPAIATAWMTVDGKFKNVISMLEKASQAAKTAGDVPLMLEVAARSWQDFLKYMGMTYSAAELVA
jgi:hypothetical protein